ncbi:uncharacterized protein DS421_14g447450 [Arachis hypogaea]|nr:uncharacterized protein DS421_14g447450 [Arachis hypogaea]
MEKPYVFRHLPIVCHLFAFCHFSAIFWRFAIFSAFFRQLATLATVLSAFFLRQFCLRFFFAAVTSALPYGCFLCASFRQFHLYFLPTVPSVLSSDSSICTRSISYFSLFFSS